MKQTVLIVDDDRVFRHVIRKKLEKYGQQFAAMTAEDGLDAVDKLKKNAVSLVVTDLQMPKMDGFALLAHLTVKYPDIPVIILTAHSTPESQRKSIESGVAGYIEKPVNADLLAEKILSALEKQSEGGMLQSISLEMFTQLVEMEAKTCTIRIAEKQAGKKGVLFFREGDLLDARTTGKQGTEAAYEIFSWDRVTLLIQDDCPVESKRITADLQAVLMDALRLKDESADAAQAAPVVDSHEIEAKIQEAEAYRTHGLYREALAIYEKLLPLARHMEAEPRDRLLEKVRSFKTEILKRYG